MEELWLGSHNVDLPIKRIRQTFQINNLADLKNRRLNFSNKFQLPLTPKNVRAMDFLGFAGSNSQKPSQKINCRYVIDGIEVIVEGSAIVSQTEGVKGYSVAVYSGNNNIYDAIKDKDISILDWTALNHTQTLDTYEDSLENTSGYIYSIGVFSENDVVWRTVINIETQFPSVFLHTIIDMIFVQAGFTYEGDVFSDPRFLNEVITPTRGIILESGSYEVDFALLFQDISQMSIVKDFMQCYGLIFRTKPLSNHIEFVNTEDLYTDRANAEDWTSKLTSKGKETYKIGAFSKANFMRYSYDENIPVEDKSFDGKILIDNENLTEEKTLFTSIYTITKYAGKKNGVKSYSVNLLEYDEDESEWTALETAPRKFSILRKIGMTSSIVQGGSAQRDITGKDIPFLSLLDLEYGAYIGNYYSALERIVNKQIKKKVTLYLSLVDIYKLDFFKLKYFSQFGQYYYLNKISSWAKNKEVVAELIQVNSISQNSPPNQLGEKEVELLFGGFGVLRIAHFMETSPVYNDPEFDFPEQIKIISGFGSAHIKLYNWNVEVTAETIIDISTMHLNIRDSSLLYGAHSREFEFQIQSENNANFSTVIGKIIVNVPVRSNRDPIADAGGTTIYIDYDNEFPDFGTYLLDGSGSYDPDGDGFTYLWTLEGAPEGVTLQAPNAEFCALDCTNLNNDDILARFTVRLRVTDEQGAFGEDTVLAVVDGHQKYYDAYQ